jgi:uncharacterized ferritin-like protein (DUF455 family)/transcriptional regulator CtsR
MKINEFAKQILFSESLSDKLYFPDEIDENSYVELKKIPTLPARDKLISIRNNKRETFPKIHELEKNLLARGKVLHFFANHELLALELMALMILQYPNSPFEFRKGLAYTIKDEQKHMRLYLEAMQRYGISFGEISLNDMFWKSLSQTKTLMEFICGMSLTFEQANLDFSYTYQKIFKKIGDLETANHLEEVYIDEINHVKNGLEWFHKWKDPSLTDWQNYKSKLISPISPIKAKGSTFIKEARLKAGFDEEFIKQLYLYQNSNGKAPDVYLFNLTAEVDSIDSKKNLTAKKNIQELEDDLSIIPWLIANSDDILIVNKDVSEKYLLYLRNNGLSYPRMMKIDEFRSYKLKLGEFKPWAWSPKTIRLLKNKVELTSKKSQENFAKLQSLDFSAVHSKLTALIDAKKLYEINSDFSYNPSMSIVLESYEKLDEILAKFPDEILVKMLYGASANKNKRFSIKKDKVQIKTYIKNSLNKQSKIIIEPWLNKIMDFSFQYECVNGKLRYIASTRFFTDDNGKYKSNVINKFNLDLDKNILKFLYQEISSKNSLLSFFSQNIKNIIETNNVFKNYSGYMGVDLFLYFDENNKLMIRPLVEYNARMNMSYLSFNMEKIIHKSSYGLFEIIEKNSYEIKNIRPLVAEGKKIKSGDLICNDIYSINKYLCVLKVYG